MDIKLDIDPKEIQNHITKTIIASSFGTTLKSAIESGMRSMSQSFTWQPILESYVKEEMRKIITDYVTKEYKDKIIDQIKVSITPEVLDMVVSKITNEVCRSIRVD